MSNQSWRDMTRVFGRIGLLSFGGPAAQIAIMQEELVTKHKWLSQDAFLRALSFCMLLPGPEAMQLATYSGWRMRGIWGGLLAGLLFVVPGALVIFALGWVYARFGAVPWVQSLFLGVQATVIIVVLQALTKLGRRALRGPFDWGLAALAFLTIFAFQLPFPLIVLGAAALGFVTAPKGSVQMITDKITPTSPRTLALWVFLWLAPIAALWASGQIFLTNVALFFAKLSVLTFGGAYAVLAYMTQSVVETHGWITTPQMVDALGLAETTPGPLILVTQFVAFLAGFGQGGIWLAFVAGLLALWVTFVPCFLWIFAGAPFLEWLTSIPRLKATLSAVTAAVVGVILNLSVWFALHVFFGSVTQGDFGPASLPIPDVSSLNLTTLALAGVAFILLFPLKRSLPMTLGIVAFLGAGLGWII